MYKDMHGIPFSEYRRALPESAHDFPQVKRIKDPKLLKMLHREWYWCLNCGRWKFGGGIEHVEIHHIVGGTKGRSDERTNLMPLCTDCHGDLPPLGRLLYLKWAEWPHEVSWVRLALLHRRFLPDLIKE